MGITEHNNQLRPATTECLRLAIIFLEAQKQVRSVRSVKDVRFFFKDFFEASYDVRNMDPNEYAHKSEQLRHSLKRLVEKGIFSRAYPKGETKRFENWSNHTLGELKKIRDHNPIKPKAAR